MSEISLVVYVHMSKQVTILMLSYVINSIISNNGDNSHITALGHGTPLLKNVISFPPPNPQYPKIRPHTLCTAAV